MNSQEQRLTETFEGILKDHPGGGVLDVTGNPKLFPVNAEPAFQLLQNCFRDSFALEVIIGGSFLWVGKPGSTCPTDIDALMKRCGWTGDYSAFNRVV